MKQETATAPLIGIARHRIATDGSGVTTLVAFHGCTLRCRFCLNASCLSSDGVWRHITPGELLEELMKDNLYFLATGGGVTFGGGEPCLRSDFIAQFCHIAPREWNITLETALNVPQRHLTTLLNHVHNYIIDIKDINPEIYKAYTGIDNSLTLSNLRWLLAHDGMSERVTVRVPLIPGHNTQSDVEKSIAALRQMGVTNFDRLTYEERTH